jgi:3-(3-hydroxy-phenyl)propionate hydroxylase
MSRVAIAGAGPVGLTAALVLARAGHEVVVHEAGHGLATESRASTFHPPTLEMLADLGVYEALARRGIVSTRFQYRDRTDGVIAELDLSVLSSDTRFPFRVQCEQSKLTPILLEAVLATGNAEVRFGSRVSDPSALDAEWVIGADGASSAVRKALGVDFEGMTYPERFLVVSTHEDVEQLLPGVAPINYVFDPVEWLVLLRTPEHWRVLFPTPHDSPDEVEQSTERVQERLRGVVDPGRDWSLLHSSLYNVHQRVASAFRIGNTVLIGDAAHVNNPLGGMGMNSGLHDAVLVARSIASGADDLDAVCEARREVAISYVRTVTHANWEMVRETSAEARAAKHAELRALAADKAAMRDYLLTTSMIRSLR